MSDKVPISCQLCKYHLEDEFFIEEYKSKDVCHLDDEISSNLIGFGCEEFKFSKWALVDYLEKWEKELKK